MKIEMLREEKFDKIKPIIQQYKKSIHEDNLEEYQFQELKKAIEDNRISFYIVIDAGNIVGMCSISSVFSTYRCEYMGIFEDFYIEPEYRKKGIAKNLTGYVFNEMKTKNINSVWVGCADVDIKMYKHLGFEIELGNLLTWSS